MHCSWHCKVGVWERLGYAIPDCFLSIIVAGHDIGNPPMLLSKLHIYHKTDEPDTHLMLFLLSFTTMTHVFELCVCLEHHALQATAQDISGILRACLK